MPQQDRLPESKPDNLQEGSLKNFTAALWAGGTLSQDGVNKPGAYPEGPERGSR